MPVRRHVVASLLTTIALVAACQGTVNPIVRRPTTGSPAAKATSTRIPAADTPPSPGLIVTPPAASGQASELPDGTSADTAPLASPPIAGPADAAVPMRLLKPSGQSSLLSGKVLLDASYIVAAGGGNVLSHNGNAIVAAGGGNVLSHNGNAVLSHNGNAIVAAGGGNIVAAGGGNVISHNGNAVLSHNGNAIVAAGGGNIVAAGGGNIVAAGGGNIVAAGGGNIVAAGGGNIVAAGGGNYRLAQAGPSPGDSLGVPASAKPGEQLPVAALAVGLLSLKSGLALPVGVDANGQPVYEVLTDERGGYQFHVPAEETGNVLVVAYVPGERLDPRLTYNLMAPAAGGGEANLDEAADVMTDYLQDIFAAQLASVIGKEFQTESDRDAYLDNLVKCDLKNYFGPLEGIPRGFPDPKATFKSFMRECSLATSDKLRRAGDREILKAARVATAPILAEADLASFESIPTPAEKRGTTIGFSNPWYHGKREPSLGALREIVRGIQVRADAVPGGAKDYFAANPFVAKFAPWMHIEKGGQAAEFVLTGLMSNPLLSRKSLYINGQISRFLDAFEANGPDPAYYGNATTAIPVVSRENKTEGDRAAGMRSAIEIDENEGKAGSNPRFKVVFDHDVTNRLDAAIKGISIGLMLMLAGRTTELSAASVARLKAYQVPAVPATPWPVSPALLNEPDRVCP